MSFFLFCFSSLEFITCFIRTIIFLVVLNLSQILSEIVCVFCVLCMCVCLNFSLWVPYDGNLTWICSQVDRKTDKFNSQTVNKSELQSTNQKQRMDEECRGVRQRRKNCDPTCCPVCGITVRPSEMEQHFSLEVDRLHKLSLNKSRKSITTSPKEIYKEPSTTTTSGSAAGCSTASVATGSSAISVDGETETIDAKECWSTYQRIKNNRNARLKVNIFLS